MKGVFKEKIYRIWKVILRFIVLLRNVSKFSNVQEKLFKVILGRLNRRRFCCAVYPAGVSVAVSWGWGCQMCLPVMR